ncbi:UDP-N-acetylmuramoyl-tripeptide--D-alanyl-D-alanine ligase [Haliea sp. E17]|uniref:UDP-N-acetylmuramoyl-tripeptide--D-alanyl-D- alanine ligase n=1 Tax=Haliea sp. E17 TaxID=3401576 RepID=UPI003AAF6798
MMRAMRLGELAGPLQGSVLGEDVAFDDVFTDSRKPLQGGLFVALRGENFDGHDYLEQVAGAGAAAALVSEAGSCALPCLQVADTLRGLGDLGAYNRALYRGPLVAITGSAGKTTAKNLIHAVLSQRGNTLATGGNLNNEIGVPLTLLRLQPDHAFAVVEMGAAKRGDIAYLCALGRPTVSVLLNAMPAHLEGFGSLEGVAQTKGEIFDGLGAGDTAVINADQPWAAQWRQRAGSARIIDFSLEGNATVCARGVKAGGLAGCSFTAVTGASEFPVRLQLAGRHNVANALAAIAVGLACGLEPEEISAGLTSVAPTAGRLSSHRAASGAVVVDDCYNANPASVHAAIDLLATGEGRRTLVMGAMRELGEASAQMHRELGEYAATAGLDGFWGVGDELREAVAAFGDGGRWFADCASAAAAALDEFTEGDTILIKGSRGARMERVLQALIPAAGGGNH